MNEPQSSDRPTPVAPPRFARPKILAIDLADQTVDLVEKAGFNVTKGTFGRPYTVAKSDQLFPVQADARLPNYTEQEIVITDLASPALLREYDPEVPALGEKALWASGVQGFIDPRVTAATTNSPPVAR